MDYLLAEGPRRFHETGYMDFRAEETLTKLMARREKIKFELNILRAGEELLKHQIAIRQKALARIDDETKDVESLKQKITELELSFSGW